MHDLWVRSPPLYRLSYKVRREQAVGTEDVKVTAMNMYKYKERLRLYKRWPCSSYIFKQSCLISLFFKENAHHQEKTNNNNNCVPAICITIIMLKTSQ